MLMTCAPLSVAQSMLATIDVMLMPVVVSPTFTFISVQPKHTPLPPMLL